MEATYTYIPKGVCSRQIKITYEGEVVRHIEFVGGCPGNTVGVARLSEGHTFQELIDLLGGIKCGSKPTSCPMQLALALQEIRQKNA